MRPSLTCLALLALACAPKPTAPSHAPAPEPLRDEASGPAARWSYEIGVDEQLHTMHVGLCIEGPRPRRLTASREAVAFVLDARVRGGPALARDGRGFAIETLGEYGCLDVEVDLEAAVAGEGRDTARRGDTLLLSPDRWLWYPAQVPRELEARARFELPDGVSATVPWPLLDAGAPESRPDSQHEPEPEWRRLDRTCFGWNAWIALGRYEPLVFEAAQSEFEVAVLDGRRRATDAGIEAWLRTAAETSAQLYGRFPRERVAVVVVPSSGWGDSPVLFGMARRGGGGSVLLLLDDDSEDDELPGEWVASHELLHLGMPLVTDPWMSEGFVTYYTQILRARQGVLARDESIAMRDPHAQQIETALELLVHGFRRARGGTRTLAQTSQNMRRFGGYGRVYWGGAAVAFDLDVRIRAATRGRRSLDDLMLALVDLAAQHRRFDADDVVALMEAEVDRWREAGELRSEISPRRIIDRHLQSKILPTDVEDLAGLAVEVDSGDVRLLRNPIGEVEVRTGMFEGRCPTCASASEVPKTGK